MSKDWNDLSSDSLFKMFQRDIYIEGKIIEGAILDFKSNEAEGGGVELMLFASSAIVGAAKLADVFSFENLGKAMAKYFRFCLIKKRPPEGSFIQAIEQAVSFVIEFTKYQEKEALKWLKGLQKEVDDCIKKLHVEFEEEIIPFSRTIEKAIDPIKKEKESPESFLWNLFAQEMLSHAKELEKALLDLEKRPQNQEHIEKGMRAAHSIKGAARVVHFDEIVELAHVLEDCFVSLQEFQTVLKPTQIDTIFQTVDLFLLLSHTTFQDKEEWMVDNKISVDQLIRALKNLFKEPSKEVMTPQQDQKITKQKSRKKEKTLQVAIKDLNQIIALSGETYVASKWMNSFTKQLNKLKKLQTELSKLSQKIERQVKNERNSDAILQDLSQMQEINQNCQQKMNSFITEINAFAQRNETLSDTLYRTTLVCRMQPFLEGVKEFPRMVRDLARRFNKRVKLLFEGLETQVDRDILSKLNAPLGHLISNAVVHGLEAPLLREELGKDEEGVILVSAKHQGGMLVIEVKDDGGGIDFEKLRQCAVEKKLVALQDSSKLSDEQLVDVAFQPGVSTQEGATEVSGRGVGLDIVKHMVQEVDGRVSLTSSPGKGTLLLLELPITLCVISSLVVVIGEDYYAFPLSNVEKVITLPKEDLQKRGDELFLPSNGEQEQIPVISASDILELGAPSFTKELFFLVVVKGKEHSFALAVDSFFGELELATRALDERLEKIPDLSATSMMEDGTPILILKVEEMIKTMEKKETL